MRPFAQTSDLLAASPAEDYSHATRSPVDDLMQDDSDLPRPASSADDIFPIVYDELRRIARRQRRSVPDAGLETTGLVHETYLKLHKTPQIAGYDRKHFFAIAARAMRQVLIDQARRQNFRRQSGQVTLTTGMNEVSAAADGQAIDVVSLDHALKKLRELDERSAQLVELRVFGGLEVQEIAQIQGVTTRTVSRDWSRACAFLIRELKLRATP
ncbi:MAG TPA: ECF-type sigma factor [Rudaea sp.]